MKNKTLFKKSFLGKVLTILALPFICLMISLFVQSCQKESAKAEKQVQEDALAKYEKSALPFRKKLEQFYREKELAKAFANPELRKKIMGVPTDPQPPVGEVPPGGGGGGGGTGEPQPYPIGTPTSPVVNEPFLDEDVANIATEAEARAILDPMIASSIDFLHSYDVTDADIIQAFGSLTDSRIPAATQEAYAAAKAMHDQNESLGGGGVASNGLSSIFISSAYAKFNAWTIASCVFEAAGFAILTDVKALLETGGPITWALLRATVKETFKKAATRLLGPIGAVIFTAELTWCLWREYE